MSKKKIHRCLKERKYFIYHDEAFCAWKLFIIDTNGSCRWDDVQEIRRRFKEDQRCLFIKDGRERYVFLKTTV